MGFTTRLDNKMSCGNGWFAESKHCARNNQGNRIWQNQTDSVWADFLDCFHNVRRNVMKKIKHIHRYVCIALVTLFFVPSGSVVMAATRANAETVVTSSDLYDAMAARTREDVAARGAIQKFLGKAEVRRVAAGAGLDLKQVQSAVSVLSGAELQAVANQAQVVDDTLVGEGSIVITTTALIIGLLVLIIILVA